MCIRGFSGDVESIEMPSADIDTSPQALARKQLEPQNVFPGTTSSNPGVVEVSVAAGPHRRPDSCAVQRCIRMEVPGGQGLCDAFQLNLYFRPSTPTLEDSWPSAPTLSSMRNSV